MRIFASGDRSEAVVGAIGAVGSSLIGVVGAIDLTIDCGWLSHDCV